MEGSLAHPCLRSLSQAIRNKLQRYVSVLKYVTKASNVSMLVSRLEARTVPVMEEVLSDLILKEPLWRSFVVESGLVNLVATAMARVMDLVVKELEAVDVLQGGSVIGTIEKICRDTSWLFSQLVMSNEEMTLSTKEVQHSWLTGQQQQAVSSGLLPSLANYSKHVVVVAISQLAADTNKHLQQRQQQQQQVKQPTMQQQKQQLAIKERSKLLHEHCHVARHVHQLLDLWDALAGVSIKEECEAYCEEFILVMPSAINITAVAVPLLSKGLGLRDIDTSTIISCKKGSGTVAAVLQDKYSEYCQLLEETRNAARSLSDMLPVIMYCGLVSADPLSYHETSGQDTVHLPEQQQQILMAEKLQEMLLSTLAYQAAALQTAALSDASTEQQDKPAINKIQHQQRHQQQCSSKHCVHYSSHRTLLAALGVPVELQTATAESFDQHLLRTSVWILRSAVHMRHLRDAQDCKGRSHNSSCIPSNNTAPTGQQHQVPVPSNGSIPVLPNHLTDPAVKTLIEIMLLLPEENIVIRAVCLEVVMMLLPCNFKAVQPSAAQPAAQPAAAAQSAAASWSATAAAVRHKKLRSAAPTGVLTGSGDSHTNTQETVWPVVPAAVAAGLLHPVLQLLSKSVLRALRTTEPQEEQQQQQQQQQQCKSRDDSPKAFDRAYLLHQYGDLLITVCQSVEPKHIAAALRSDPVNPLVAIEAVIREQMGPDLSRYSTDEGDKNNGNPLPCAGVHDSLQQQQQQQQQQHSRPAATAAVPAAMSASTTSSRSGGESGNLQQQPPLPLRQQQQPVAQQLQQVARQVSSPSAATAASGDEDIMQAHLGTLSSSDVPLDSTQHSSGSSSPTALLLLPFVTKVVCAVRDLLQARLTSLQPSTTSQLYPGSDPITAISYRAPSTADSAVIVRVFSLISTTCKVADLAAANYRQEQAILYAQPGTSASFNVTGTKKQPATTVAAAASCMATDADNPMVVMQWLTAGTTAIADIADAMRHMFILEHTCTDPANNHNQVNTTDSRCGSNRSVDSNSPEAGVSNSPLTSCSSAIVLIVKTLTAVADQLHADNMALMSLLTAGNACRKDPHSLAARLSTVSPASRSTVQKVVATASSLLQSVRSPLDQLRSALSEQHRATTVWGLKYGSDAFREALPIWLWQVERLGELCRSRHAHLSNYDHVPDDVAASSHCGNQASTTMVSLSCWDSSLLSTDDVARTADQHQIELQQATYVSSQLSFVMQQMHSCTASILLHIPVPFCCNNPSCVNMSKLSEYQLVSGKACVCGGCKVARYCSRVCQKKHWKQHKNACQRCPG